MNIEAELGVPVHFFSNSTGNDGELVVLFIRDLEYAENCSRVNLRLDVYYFRRVNNVTPDIFDRNLDVVMTVVNKISRSNYVRLQSLRAVRDYDLSERPSRAGDSNSYLIIKNELDLVGVLSSG
ncbi:MAG: hypothetical protein ABIK73_07085 [candidate division WOR-3 bacterium]